MRTEYRKKPPYYGKYNFKLDTGAWQLRQQFGSLGSSVLTEKEGALKFIAFIKTSIKKENYLIVNNSWSSWPMVYVANIDDIDVIFASEYKKYIWCFTKPSPGYVNAKKIKKEDRNTLWYGRFPYRIILNISDNLEFEETLEWCEENVQKKYSKSGNLNKVSYYFINSIDAMAFKLRFSDWLHDTKIPDNKLAKKLLKNRIKQAEKDLEIFLEGV